MDRVTSLDVAMPNRRESIWIDVRSPIEFEHAHIPGAVSLPLFSNDQRAHVGTLYKEQGPLVAMQVGLGYLMDRLPQIERAMISAYESSTLEAPETSGTDTLARGGARAAEVAVRRPLMIYCARGGMRSEYMTRLAHALGLPVSRLKGGYKQFRHWVIEVNNKERSLSRVGGLTGSGKTRLLQRCQLEGARIVDLEALACHRGSVLGGLNRLETWGSEMFENRLAMRLDDLDRAGGRGAIWLEDESRMIGPCKIPDGLYEQMRHSPLYLLESDTDRRLDLLLEDYAFVTDQQLLAASEKLFKRLGSHRCEQIREAVASSDRRGAYAAWLDYYDRHYHRHLEKQTYESLSSEALRCRIFGPL